MQKVTLTAAVMTVVAGLMAAGPASAERNPGPMVQNGKCWSTQVNHGFGNSGTWGYWADCPQTASAVAVPHRHRHHRA